MKINLALLLFLMGMGFSARSQWTTSGNNISNSNSGSVGIGNTSAGTKLAITIPVSTSNVSGDPNAYGLSISDAVSSSLAIRSLGNGVMHLATDVPGRKMILGGGQFEQTLTVNSGGNVGIGTTSPSAKLEINQTGGNSGQNVGAKIWGGNSYNYFGNSQIQFSFGGGGGAYSHAIKSRHNSNAISGNAQDFYLWQPGDNVNGEGSLNVMTLNGGNVGIGTASPNTTLSVKGRLGVRADANPSAPAETMRIEGASSSEENVMNVTNMVDQDFLVRLSGVGAATKRTIIGPSTSTRFSLGVGVNSGNEYLTILNGGNVGIGTTSPSGKLTVSGGGIFWMQTSPYAVVACGLYRATPHLLPWEILVHQQAFRFDAGAVARMYVDGTSGFVGIGTTNPDYPLTVKGSIHAKEVRVDLTGSLSVPDYVFEKDYKLTSLEDIKTYIDQNKHLPEVPSAKEIEKNGVQLGEMNLILLKKIEELTLYVIELKKQNESAENRMKSMQQEIDSLKK